MNPNRPIIDQVEWTEEQLQEIATIKRFAERFQGDPSFRKRLPVELNSVMDEYGFDMDAEAYRPVWDTSFPEQLKAGKIKGYEPPESLTWYSLWLKDRFRWRDAVRAACSPMNDRWSTWRDRQMQRATGEMGDGWCQGIIFDTAAIEISKGCSVGCWFCGVDAPELEGHLLHTPETGRLFKGVVEVLADLVGPQSAAAHFLYWATDPLDNPDYEHYCREFKDALGVFPMTTTAIALRDVERTRRMLAMFAEDPTAVHRFSVLTLKTLNGIHEAFTARELLQTELVLLQKESMVVKANAGRLRTQSEKNSTILERESSKIAGLKMDLSEVSADNYEGPGTIACVSGLLINLVEKNFKLITPCKANERWPLGYVVFDQADFDSPEELRTKALAMVEKHMPKVVPGKRIARLRADVKVELEDQGFTASSEHLRLRLVRSTSVGKSFREIGRLVGEGSHTSDEIANEILGKFGVFPNVTFEVLDNLFSQGFLFEEPEGEIVPEKLVQLSSVALREDANVPA